MKFHSNRNDRSWHSNERRITAALRETGDMILAFRAAGMTLDSASKLAVSVYLSGRQAGR